MLFSGQYARPMKATKQYFTVVLFIILCNVVVTFESTKKISYVWQLKSRILSSIPVVLIIMLFKVVATFESMHEIM